MVFGRPPPAPTQESAIQCSYTAVKMVSGGPLTVVAVRMAAATSLHLHIPLIGTLYNSLYMLGFGRVGDCDRYGVYFVVVRLHVCDLVVVFARKRDEFLWNAFEEAFLKAGAGRIPHLFCVVCERG